MDDLISKVAEERLRAIQRELPPAEVVTHFQEDERGRGLIDIVYQGALVGQEIIETQDSWKEEGRLAAYQAVLRKKVRLVVVAPRGEAMRVRYMMLELNNCWLFYYMVYSYDPDGHLMRVLRPAVPGRREPAVPYIQ